MSLKLKPPVHIVLQRGKEDTHGMRGVLQHMDKTLCYTLEEPWRDNRKQVSCIPPGTYKCFPHDGAHFKDVWQVLDVPGRSAILIHAGNTLADTQGCILVGLGVSPNGITKSQLALKKLRELLPDRFTLEVRSS
jgi:hypothetical protein